MTAESSWGRIGRLRSKVGRGMFLLFVGCALVPVGVMALVWYLEVRSNLDDLSAKRLHQACKSTGMTLVERLSFLESDLHLIAANLVSRGAGNTGPVALDVGDRMAARFRSLAVLSDDRATLAANGSASPYLAPSAEGRGHLRAGGTLVTHAPGGGGQAVFIARLLDPAARTGRLLVGEVDPDYLWGGEGFLSPSTELCVLGEDGRTLFTSLAGGASARPPDGGPSGRFEWSRGGEEYVAGYWTAFMQPTYLTSWVIVQSEPRADVERPLRRFGWTFWLVVLSTFWIVSLVSLRTIRRRTDPIDQLIEATRRLKAEDFSHRVSITSDDEYAALGAAFNDMAESIERHVSVMNTANRIGVALSAEKDEARLLETVLAGAQSVFNADAAGLFLLGKDGRPALSLAHVRSLSLWQRPTAADGPGGAGAAPRSGPPMPAARDAAERALSTPDVYAASGEDFADLIEFDRRLGYRSQSFISVPLRNHENEVIGILQLINAQTRATGAVVAFGEEDRRLMESLASQAAVAITKNRLVQDFKGLFEGLTDLISAAIDEQSPHTGGHVRRVVVLSGMIGEALSRSSDPALRERALSAEEQYELRIAALLHDCGKLTTPVHLTDKATKLQAIVDRMRLVEARAEAARREYRIGLLQEALRRAVPAGELEARVEADAAEFDRRIAEELAVLRRCNQGTERMSDALAGRVREIGTRYTWSTVGGEKQTLLSEDEMYHLETRRGTLTREEREVVEGHVTSTIKMLERLPYPKRLRNVPLYAGAHHEQLTGRGYPLRRAGEDIPLQGRIIAIADVLEALTARDRPYRPAMRLAEAMRVLGEMARHGAVDPALYELILSEDIHKRYAEEYL